MSFCSPRRPDESRKAYSARWKIARDTWRRNYVDNFRRQQQEGLLSPDSDGFTQQEIANSVENIERDILIDQGLASHDDFVPRRTYSPIVFPPGTVFKSLSELSDEEKPPEVLYDANGSPILRHWSSSPLLVPEDISEVQLNNISESLGTSRRSISQSATSGHTRKRRRRTEEEVEVEADNTEETRIHIAKKCKTTDSNLQPPETSANKRKREAGDEKRDDNHDSLKIHGLQPSRREIKRRRTEKHTTPNMTTEPVLAAQSTKKRRITHTTAAAAAAATSPFSLPPSSSRITRARRRQLSGEVAHHFQLGQRGEPQVIHEGMGRHAELEAIVDPTPPKASAIAVPKKRSAKNKTKAGDIAATGRKARNRLKSQVKSKSKAEATDKHNYKGKLKGTTIIDTDVTTPNNAPGRFRSSRSRVGT